MIIKKLNSLFHRHSRWLFGAFTVIIIIAFMDFLTPGNIGFESSGANDTVGTAYGKKVTYNDLRRTSQKMSVFVELVYGGQMRNLDNAEIFNQFCLIEKALQMGLVATDKEVADLIRKTPAFMTDGKFDPAKRQTIIKNWRSSGISEDIINDSFRDQILVSKLQRELSTGITVSENEAETLFRMVNAKNKIKIAEFKAVAPAVNTLKAEEVKAFFDANRSKYVVPGKVAALIVEFPYASYKAQAAAEAKDAKTLEKFFLARIAEFSTDKKPAPKFADVKQQVAKRFVEEQASYLARKAGYEFASAVFEASNGKDEKFQRDTFAKTAAEKKYNVIAAKSVNFDSDSIGGIKNAELIRQLIHTPVGSLVTNTVNGEKAVYVAIACNRVNPRPAELKEVELQVKKDCAADKGRKIAQDKALKVFTDLVKITDPAKREAALAKAANGKLKSVTYSLSSLPNNPEDYSAAQITANIKVGEITPAYPVADGSIIAMLVKRTAADMKNFAKEKEQFTAICRNQKIQLAILSLQEDISRNCSFTAVQEQQ